MSATTPNRTAPVSKTCTLAEWRAEAAQLFGPDPLGWRFVCPACGHIASTQDYKDAGAPSSAVGFSCVGRWTGAKRDAFGLNPKGLPTEGPGQCNYAGAGLFNISPVVVTDDEGKEVQRVFAFASEHSGPRIA